MCDIVQERSAGGLSSSLPVIFYSPREAQDFAAALSAQDRADDPAPPLPLRQDNERGDGQ